MPSVPLKHRPWLDPRDADEARKRPIADGVNIPLAELPDRTHELPSRQETIGVAGPEALVRETIEWLDNNRRRAFAVAAFDYTEDLPATEYGRLWRPSGLLERVLPNLPPGSMLDLACGCGREAVFAAASGWNVTGVDVLPDALERAASLASHCGLPHGGPTWVTADLESGSPDWNEPFDLITGFRYLHRPLFARFKQWLRPGGSILYETFTVLHRQRLGKPGRDEHVLKPGELRQLLNGFEIRLFSEDWIQGAHLARAWAVAPA